MSAIAAVSYHPEYMGDSIHESVRKQIVALQEYALNRVTTVSPALAIGSSSTADIRINAAVDYIRDGQKRTQKAAAEVNVPSGATMADDGTNREVIVLVYINASDAFTALAGTIARNGEAAEIPLLPAGCVQLGYVKIAAAAGTAYTADSTALSAAGITDTYVDLLVPTQNWEVPTRMGNM
jgi:hypothetical protein